MSIHPVMSGLCDPEDLRQALIELSEIINEAVECGLDVPEQVADLDVDVIMDGLSSIRLKAGVDLLQDLIFIKSGTAVLAKHVDEQKLFNARLVSRGHIIKGDTDA